jgi:hypothetical protein
MIEMDELLKSWADQKTIFIATKARLLENVVGLNGGNYDAIHGGEWIEVWPAQKPMIMFHTTGNKTFVVNTSRERTVHRALGRCHDDFAVLERLFRKAKRDGRVGELDLGELTDQERAHLK